MRAPDPRNGAEPDDAHLSSARTRELAGGAGEPAKQPEPAEAVPAKIGQFTILQQVGQGGMGVVYSAYDTRLDRKVAIKLLRPSHGDSLGRARLLREAQAMAKLAHPNIVRVYEVLQLAGDIYLVMEFVQGETLRRWLRQSKRPWREVLRVLTQAGEGLAAAHAAGLVHRDFKPDNVIVAEDGFVRVLDFGLARNFEAGDAGSSGSRTAREPVAMLQSSHSLSDQLTQVGTLIGTPAYMSPEQFAAGAVDAHSDQFSFCVVLYEGLYGHRPFKAQTAAELHVQVGMLQSAEAPRKTGVPGRLRRILLRGLCAAPQERWPSMPALLAELRREPGKQAKSWAAGGTIVALAAGLGLSLAPRQAPAVCQDAAARFAGAWDDARRAEVEQALRATGIADADEVWQRVEPLLDDYAARWTALYTDSCEATSVRGEQSAQLMDLQMACLRRHRTEVAWLVDGLARADADTARRAVQATLALGELDGCTDTAALLAEVPPPDDPDRAAAVAAVREKLAQVRVTGSLGQFERSRALMAEVVAEAEALAYLPLQAEALLRQADLTDVGGDSVTAEKLFREAFFTAGVARHDHVQAEAANNLVYVLGAEQARYDEALEWDRHAKMLLARLGDPVRLQISRYNGLGTMMERWGKFSEGQQHLDRALELAEATGAEDPIRLATVLLNSGSLYLAQSNFAVAEQRYRRSLEIYTRVLGPNNPAVPDCFNNLGQVAFMQADLATAHDYFLRALTSWEHNFGPTHPRLTYPLENLGGVATAQRDWAPAQAYYERALALLTTAKGPEDPELAQPLGGLAELFAAKGDWAAAERDGTRAVLLFEQSQGPEHPYLGQPLCALGEAALGQRKFSDARTIFTRALTIAERSYGPTDLGVLPPLDGLGRVALAERRPAEAIAPLERALGLLQTTPTLPDRRGRIQLALARALWDTQTDRPRALTLADQARADYEAAGQRFAGERDEVTAWLAARR